MRDYSLEVLQAIAWGTVLIPLGGAIFACCRPKQITRSFNKTLTRCSWLSFLCAMLLYPVVFIFKAPVQTGFGYLLSGLRLKVDALGLFFALFTSLIWSLASMYNGPYLRSDDSYRSYAGTWLLALSANIGLVLAADLFTFFIFFETLSFSAYLLITHNRTEEAWKAGNKYLYMSISGGLLLLFGILCVYSYSGSLSWTAVWQVRSSTVAYKWELALATIIIGLGIKAGMMPLHIWLPDAHPVAPAPASALLSGVMIKAGAYGMVRIAQGYIQIGSSGHWAAHGQKFGYCLLWAGLVSMLLGVTFALLQHNAKRLLAYHSISQMGYIIFGIGMCMYLGSADALLGSIYHILNHALFKSALFLAAGVIYWHSGKVDLRKLGGWNKLAPITFGCALIASAGISGIPPFNGYISKTLLHASLTQGFSAAKLNFAGEAELIDAIFIITSAGTLVSFIKFMSFIFIFPAVEKQMVSKPTPPAMQAPIIVLSALILVIGLFPRFWLNYLIIPALGPAAKLPVLNEIHFWSIHELSGAGITVILGGLLFAIAYYTKFFYKHWPAFPIANYFYGYLGYTGLYLVRLMGTVSEGFRIASSRWAEQIAGYYYQAVERYNLAVLIKNAEFSQQVAHELGNKLGKLGRPKNHSWDLNKYYSRVLEKEHVIEEILEEDFFRGKKWVGGKRNTLIDKQLSNLSKIKTWVINKGENCLGSEEELTLSEVIRKINQYYSRDLNLGLFLVLFVLLVFLSSLML